MAVFRAAAPRREVLVAAPPRQPSALIAETVDPAAAMRSWRRRGQWICSVCGLPDCFLAPRIWSSEP
jgi:hypothetical protein